MSFDQTLKKGTTSKIIEFMLRDSTTGQGKTGLTTGDMSGASVREGGTHTSLSFSAGSAGDSYSATKFAEVDATNMPGVYQYHLPNTVLASGVDAVTIRFGATNCLDRIVRINLLDVNLYDAAAAGISNLDAATSSRAAASDLAAVDTVVDAIKVVTDRLDTALVLDGSVYQFTTNALENAPSGGGGGDSAATIYTYFTSSSREDVFKANISGLSTFDPASDSVTVSTNNDKSGYSISGTVTTLDGLNDIAATDIVSGGAITTSGGAVSNVTLVATTTTNSDMRGTDSAFLASSAPANFSSFAITAAGKITVGTNDDKTGYEINGSLTTLDDLDLITEAEVNAQVDLALSDIGLDHLLSASVTGTDITDNSIVAKLVSKEATADWDDFNNTTDSLQAIRDRGDSSWGPGSVPSASEIADAVLDEALADHTTSGSLGKAVADIETETDNNSSKLTTIDGKVDTVDGIVDLILVDTGTTLPNTLTTIDNEIAVIDGNVDLILTDTGTTLPATLATLSTLDAAGVRSAIGLSSNNLDTQLQAIDSNVDAILIDTATTIPNQISNLNDLDAAGVRSAVGLSTNDLDTQLQTIDANVDSILVDTSTTIPNQINLIPDSGAIADAVWDESLSQHNTGGSTGKALKNLKEGIVSYEGQVDDASATTTSFITNLVSSIDDFYNSQTIHFISGILQGQSRLVLDYDGSTKTITVEEALSSAPADGTEFIILSTHVHTITEIADGVWNEAKSGHSTVGTFGYYLDARVSQVGGGGGASAADIWGALLVDYATPGTFGARFQEADRYTNTTANIRYITQGNSYDGTANPEISWAVSKDYTAYDVVLQIIHRVTGTVLLNKAISATDATTIKASLSATDTAFTNLTTPEDFGPHRYIITATSGSSVDSAVIGAVVITET